MSNMIDKYDNLTGYKQKFSKLDVKSHFPKLKESDYNKGFIIRYFVQKVNDLNSSIYEIKSSSYSSYNNNPYFIASNIRWRIKGPKKTIYDEDGSIIEMQVNPEFKDKSLAEVEAKKYAFLIGQLPAVLRKDIQTSWIHKGVNPFGGGNNNILIHTGQTKEYEKEGILEETLIHEASHTSLDSYHAKNYAWQEAQRKDNHFISGYAEENPMREDIAESFLTYIAASHRSDRISPELKLTILKTIPNRIKYFDNQNFDLSIYSK